MIDNSSLDKYCLWPDGTYCEFSQRHEMTHMSDDFQVVFGEGDWEDLDFLDANGNLVARAWYEGNADWLKAGTSLFAKNKAGSKPTFWSGPVTGRISGSKPNECNTCKSIGKDTRTN